MVYVVVATFEKVTAPVNSPFLDNPLLVVSCMNYVGFTVAF